MAQLGAYNEQAENLAKEFSGVQETVKQISESTEVKSAKSDLEQA
jgi:hypothetical protein